MKSERNFTIKYRFHEFNLFIEKVSKKVETHIQTKTRFGENLQTGSMFNLFLRDVTQPIWGVFTLA